MQKNKTPPARRGSCNHQRKCCRVDFTCPIGLRSRSCVTLRSILLLYVGGTSPVACSGSVSIGDSLAVQVLVGTRECVGKSITGCSCGSSSIRGDRAIFTKIGRESCRKRVCQ